MHALIRERLDRNWLALVFDGSAARQVNVHRLENAATAECRLRAAGDQKRLVDVMVQDEPELLEVVPAEGAAQFLAQVITDRVWVPETFALDDLDRAPSH